MAEGSPLDRVPNTERLDPTQSVQPGTGANTPEAGKFSQHMGTTSNQAASTNPSNQPSPMQAAAKQAFSPSSPPTMESIQGQMKATSSRLGDIKTQLHTKNLKLKQSDKYLIRNKLGQANDHLQKAAQHLGAKTAPPSDLRKIKNPLNKFLAMVSDGQQQLNSAATQLRNLNTSGQDLNAGEMLLVQVKLQKAQQELDYTSVLLGKAIDMIKTLLNVQI